ncbi:Granulins [Araneus ventricosus]|uniref:Granulins n=1 Tax=Araneus ventricosus TaxID=182803 RepID=A0A4Y2C5V6_ARAVE|nr:Granulins [Araneus ventricosus]
MGFWIILIFISLASAVEKECPGGTFTCRDSATCCQLTDKSYGCCPMENAVCCDDHIHCCPANTKCATGMCIQSSNRSVENRLLRKKNVTCDYQSVCPEGTTCCKNPYIQKIGCCPMESAVCCDDGLHCCPEGTTCNLAETKCDGDGYVTQIYDSHKISFDSIISNITLSPLRSNKESSVICPSGQYRCPDRNTCCKLPNQGYSCCPLVRASCCIDGLHCCPEHTHCDPTSRYCNQGARNVTSLRQIPAEKIPPTVENVKESSVICQGGQYECPDRNTCCTTFIGYGCCPLVRATCCRYGSYCCPEHTHCDPTSRYCKQDARNVTSLRQIPAEKIPPTVENVKESSVICPGGQYQCPDRNTCCKLPNQGYSCCPLVRASCCIDGLHCCPEHMHCDPTSRYCNQGARNVTSLRQIPAERSTNS